MENGRPLRWELLIADGRVPVQSFDCLDVGDVDGDGKVEVVAGGAGGLFWYRPGDWQRQVIATGVNLHVGMALEDVDGDGRLEVFVGQERVPPHEHWIVSWYDWTGSGWQRHVAEADLPGGPHDILFADLDGDGRRELVTLACYTSTPGVFALVPGGDPAAPWRQHAIQRGVFAEGLSVADLDGDGRLEIVSGPDWYRAPPAGAFSGPWARRTYAPSHREMCRTAVARIAGGPNPDLVIVDSEYMDGCLSWFENRLGRDGEGSWVEHVLDDRMIYAHSLTVRQQPDGARIFVGEMEEGGWWAPRNYDARLLEFRLTAGGSRVERTVLHRGEGTHQAMLADVDGDGADEVIGKTCEVEKHAPKLQLWKRRPAPLAVDFRHSFVDRDKPCTGVELLAADVDGDGREDVLCGAWWYHNPGWERYPIPGIEQVIAAADLDGDGRQEVVALKGRAGATPGDWYGRLTSQLVWLRPVDPVAGRWEEHAIGTGRGDWVHGCLVAPVLPGGRLALITGYHDADSGSHPEIWEVPADPARGPWAKQVLAEIPYGEQFAACDVDGDGRLDIVAGAHWLECGADGRFRPHAIAADLAACRVAVWDVNGDGRPDVVLGAEVMDFDRKQIPLSPVAWYENPGPGVAQPWPMHPIDVVRCAHSLSVDDVDGDGEPEVIVGEHDPFWAYRSRCRLLVYKKADPVGRTWHSRTLDSRFEHHVGAKVFSPGPGRTAILSHGWKDSIYVHLWEVERHG